MTYKAGFCLNVSSNTTHRLLAEEFVHFFVPFIYLLYMYTVSVLYCGKEINRNAFPEPDNSVLYLLSELFGVRHFIPIEETKFSF